MISAILWKEQREHRMVWVALAVIAAALLLGMPFVMAPGGLRDQPNHRQPLLVAAVALVSIYGMICGVMLLAGEREAGTLTYLDTLPGLRRRLWLAKFLAGVLLVLAQIVFVMVVAAVGHLFENWAEAAWTLGGMICCGLYALAWGLLFSSFGRRVMNLILMCFCGQVLANLLALPLAHVLTSITMAVLAIPYPGDVGSFPWIIAGGISFLTVPAALAGSALVFTRLDRRRLWTPLAPSPAKRGEPRVSWSALFWLTWRQVKRFAAGLAVFALVLGFFALVQGVILWPLTTMLVGVLCGVTTFADEQDGPFRFLGDQRFPLGRLWLVKVGVGFALAVAAAVIVLAPGFQLALGKALAYSQSRSGEPAFLGGLLFFTFHSSLIGLVIPPGLFLTIWVVYGFATGCVCGILFRNGLAAGVFAMITSTLLTAVWLPSLLAGGLHAWQVFGPPVLLLLSTRWLLRPWVAGRIASWTTAVRLIPFVGLVVLWIAGALWYRVLEIPYVPEKADLDVFRASLPKPEENEGGDLTRRACLRFDDLRRTLGPEQPPPRRQGDAALPVLPPFTRADNVLDHGWADDVELAAWLDKLCADDWVGMLKKAADLPPGMFDDLRNLTEMGPLPASAPARDVAVVLAARGLQRQAVGDDEDYVENLRIGLHLSQTMRHRAPALDVIVSRAVESILVKGLDRWLEKLKGRPDLLQKALDILSRHLDATAEDGDQELADDLIIRNTVDDPLAMMEVYFGDEGWWPGRNYQSVRAEAQWMELAGFVPWERERQDRILRVIFWGDDKVRRHVLGPFSGIGPLAQLGPYRWQRSMTPRQQAVERAMQLKLALRWFQADNNKPADNLDELVPKYLKSIPLDPYDGRPFRYRLSQGEEIEWRQEPTPAGGVPVGPPGNGPGMPGDAPAPPPTRKVPPGQGVLWCVGENGVDDGAHRQAEYSVQSPWGEDVIFLVPLPSDQK